MRGVSLHIPEGQDSDTSVASAAVNASFLVSGAILPVFFGLPSFLCYQPIPKCTERM